MTGAGFGGATINIVRRDAVERLRETVLRSYPSRTGLAPSVYAVEAVVEPVRRPLRPPAVAGDGGASAVTSMEPAH